MCIVINKWMDISINREADQQTNAYNTTRNLRTDSVILLYDVSEASGVELKQPFTTIQIYSSCIPVSVGL